MCGSKSPFERKPGSGDRSQSGCFPTKWNSCKSCSLCLRWSPSCIDLLYEHIKLLRFYILIITFVSSDESNLTSMSWIGALTFYAIVQDIFLRITNWKLHIACEVLVKTSRLENTFYSKVFMCGYILAKLGTISSSTTILKCFHFN